MISSLFPSEGDVVQIAFADALKDEVAAACGVTKTFIEQNKDKFRLILQGWGTDFRRGIYGDDYWIKQCLFKMTRQPDYVNMIILTDVRFPNEADVVHQAGGKLFRVTRCLPSNNDDIHPSEIALDNYKFDDVIENNGSMEQLRIQVNHLLVKHKLLPNYIAQTIK